MSLQFTLEFNFQIRAHDIHRCAKLALPASAGRSLSALTANKHIKNSPDKVIYQFLSFSRRFLGSCVFAESLPLDRCQSAPW